MNNLFSPSRRAWIGLAARLPLGIVFLVAGLLKLGDPAAAMRAVRAYQALPAWLEAPVGLGLPIVEILLGGLLLLGLGSRLAASISAALLIVFIAGIAQASWRGLTIDCGCFGKGGPVAANRTQYTQEIFRDLGLLLLAGYLAWWPESRFSLDPRIPHEGN